MRSRNIIRSKVKIPTPTRLQTKSVGPILPGDVENLIEQNAHKTPLCRRQCTRIPGAFLRRCRQLSVKNGIPLVSLQPLFFDPPPDTQMEPGPTHDLATLLAETLSEAARLLNQTHFRIEEIKMEWSHRLVKGWFAKAYWGTGQRKGHWANSRQSAAG